MECVDPFHLIVHLIGPATYFALSGLAHTLRRVCLLENCEIGTCVTPGFPCYCYNFTVVMHNICICIAFVIVIM
jgi:hypothetical protein